MFNPPLSAQVLNRPTPAGIIDRPEGAEPGLLRTTGNIVLYGGQIIGESVNVPEPSPEPVDRPSFEIN